MLVILLDIINIIVTFAAWVVLTFWGVILGICALQCLGYLLYSQRAEHAEQELELHKHLVSQIPEDSLVMCGPFTLNAMTGQAFLGNDGLLLAPKEFSVLLHLIGHDNEIVSREAVYEAVWRQKISGKNRALISSVSRLRRKIEGSGYRIVSMRGQGYRLEKDL